MIHTILTHAGTFHADEVLAVAFLSRISPHADVVRTYSPTIDQFNDPNCIILDIGRVYDVSQNNYDHHQNPELPAANMLILQQFYQDAGLSLREKQLLEEYLFGYVSNVDTGKVVESLGCAPTINSIIRSLNNVESGGFNTAVSVAATAIDGAIQTARRRIKSENDWKNVEVFGQYAIWDSPEHLVGWHELAAESGVNYLITPNIREVGAYQITSRDSSQYPIPQHPSQTFLHNSGFLAAYKSKEDAIIHVEVITLNLAIQKLSTAPAP